MSKPVLWSGLEVSTSKDVVKTAYPEALERGNLMVLDIALFECDFSVEFQFDHLGLSKVSMLLVRSRHNSFQDVCQQLIAAMTMKYGRGQAPKEWRYTA